MQARNKTSISTVSHTCKSILDEGIYRVIIKIQECVNWVSALSFVLFDFFINNPDDGIENIFIKPADE